jgi:hypothetical protein
MRIFKIYFLFKKICIVHYIYYIILYYYYIIVSSSSSSGWLVGWLELED